MTDDQIRNMDRQLKRIESNMATKDDLRAMDNRFKGIERHLADQEQGHRRHPPRAGAYVQRHGQLDGS